MLCIAPFKTGKEEFGCGKCVTCKFAKRRTMVGRIMLELACHKASCFATLTYKEAPSGYVESDVRLFFKRLRRKVAGVRYLLVGERGSRSGRVHYHVALFGVSISQSAVLRECWNAGFVDVGELNEASAAYLVKYMLKSNGDEKPFRRMSLKPGIGGLVVKQLAGQLAPLFSMEVIKDVPVALRSAGRMYPISGYVRRKVRVECGMPHTTPSAVRAISQAEYAAECPVSRENRRVNGYESALGRMAIMKSKEKL